MIKVEWVPKTKAKYNWKNGNGLGFKHAECVWSIIRALKWQYMVIVVEPTGAILNRCSLDFGQFSVQLLLSLPIQETFHRVDGHSSWRSLKVVWQNFELVLARSYLSIPPKAIVDARVAVADVEFYFHPSCPKRNRDRTSSTIQQCNYVSKMMEQRG